MKEVVVIIISIILFCSACTAPGKDSSQEIAYRYYGNFVSLVDQKNEPISKELKINFTLQLKNFNPSEKIFETYNTQFEQVNTEYKHIEITKNTKVYKLHDNERKEVPVITIEDSDRLEIWIKSYKLSDYHIEALEIYILE